MSIFVFSFLTLLIPAVEFLLYCTFLDEYIEDLASNNITIGFSALIYGWEANRIKFSLFGGPFIALGIYLVVGWTVMLSPQKMADQLNIGVVNGAENTNTILNITLEQKELLGSVKVKKHKNGYLRLLYLLICHFYMLVNSDFWRLMAHIIKKRWCAFVLKLSSYISVRPVAYFFCAFCLPIYITMCFIEITVVFLYFPIPMIGFIFCVIRGFRKGLHSYVQRRCCINCPRIRLVFESACCISFVVILFYYIYVFTVLFFDSFFFFLEF